MLFAPRFDVRNPDIAGTTMADRYAAALDMAGWADRLGCANIVVSEHHSSPDGYLPSPIPIPMLAAMAAHTNTVRFLIGALIAPFHDRRPRMTSLHRFTASPISISCGRPASTGSSHPNSLWRN